MKGINSVPIVELDSMIDVESFNNLYEEIIAGISRSSSVAGSWGPGVYDIGDYDLYSLELGSYLNRGSAPRHKDYDLICKATEGMSLNQKRLYLKIKYGLYNAGISVYVRDVKNRDYKLINSALGTTWDNNVQHFPGLVKWIDSLPFEEVGRVIFFVNEHNCTVTEHSDLHHGSGKKDYKATREYEYEFIWIRPDCNSKPFYVLDETTGVRHYVKGQSAWFNSFDVHGADAHRTMTWSLRVDGKFSKEFRSKLAC